MDHRVGHIYDLYWVYNSLVSLFGNLVLVEVEEPIPYKYLCNSSIL